MNELIKYKSLLNKLAQWLEHPLSIREAQVLFPAQCDWNRVEGSIGLAMRHVLTALFA